MELWCSIQIAWKGSNIISYTVGLSGVQEIYNESRLSGRFLVLPNAHCLTILSYDVVLRHRKKQQQDFGLPVWCTVNTERFP